MSQVAESGRTSGAAFDRSRWLVLAVVAIAPFMSFLDITIANVAFPDLERSFPDADRSELSWVLNAYNIVLAATLVVAGRLADRVGRKRVYLWALAAFTAGSLLVAAAPSAEALIAARAFQALGAAAVVPTSLALLLVAFPRSQQATAIGILAAVGAAASALGPTAGGFLIDSSGWRSAFAINVPIGIVATIAALRVLPESRDARSSPFPDVFGILTVTLAVALVSLALVQGADWGWLSGPILLSFAGAAILGALTLRRSALHPAPVVELALLRYRSFAVANLGVACFGAAFYAMLLCSILFLTTAWGYSELEAGAAFTPVAIATMLAAGPAGRLTDRLGHRAVIIPGALIFALAMAGMATSLGSRPAFLVQWLPLAVVAGTGIALAFPTFSSAAAAALPSARFATGSGVMAAARQLGAAIGVAALIALVGTPSTAEIAEAFDRGWVFSAAAALAAAAVSTQMAPRIRAASDAVLERKSPIALADATRAAPTLRRSRAR